MSVEACLADVLAVMPDAKESVANDVAEAMNVYLRHAEAAGGISREQALVQATEKVGQALAEATKVKKLQETANFIARQTNQSYIERSFAGRFKDGLKAKLVGINSNISGSRVSAAAHQNELRDTYISSVQGGIQREGLWEEFINGVHDRDVARELWALDTGTKATDNEAAQKIAKVIFDTQEMARMDANKAGAFIKKLPGYITKQAHDMFKIRRAGEEKWISDIETKLDWQRMELEMGRMITDRRKFLKNVYKGVGEGRHVKADRPSGGGFTGMRNLAKGVSAERVLHFKSADDWVDYNSAYGIGDMVDSVHFGLEKNAMNTGLMRVWGPSAESNIKMVMDTLIDKAPDAAQADKLKNYRDGFPGIKADIAALDGSSRIPGNEMAATYSSAVRAIQSMSKLGGAVISSLTDTAFFAGELRYQGGNIFDSYSHLMRGFATNLKKGERAELLRALSVSIDTMNATVHSRFDVHDDMPGRLSKLQGKFFKWNLLTQWTDRMRVAAAMGMSNRAAQNAGKSFDQLSDDLRRAYELFDITADDWDLLRAHTLRDVEGEQFMVTEAIQDIPDAAIQKIIGADASARKIGRYRDELRSKYHAYLIDRMEHAAIRPDQRTDALLKFGTQPGTVMGEFIRFVMQFKAFPVAVIQKAIGREFYGRGAISFTDALKRGDTWTGMTSLMAQSTVLGYVAASLKEMVKGREPLDPARRDTWKRAALQGGGAGFYGDILFGELRKTYGGGPIGSMLGPTIGAVENVMDLAGRARDGDPVAGKAMNLLIQNTPGANLFYFKAAVDYGIMYQVQDMLDPGYLRRMERRLKDTTGQSYLLRPTEAVQ